MLLSIKLTWVGGFVTFSLPFIHMVNTCYNALNNNQWLIDSLKIHALTT